MEMAERAFTLRNQLRDGAIGSIASGDRLKHWCSIMQTYDEWVTLHARAGRFWRESDSMIVGG